MPRYPRYELPGPPSPVLSDQPDVLADGLSWLTQKLKAHASEVIVYSRGFASVALRATRGRTLLKLDDGAGGVRMEWTDCDWLIPAADLHFGGPLVIPERGDRLSALNGTELWSVLPYDREPVWRWSDPHRSMIRVHVKRGVS